MKSELRDIISDFQSKVAEANELLKVHLGTEEPHKWGYPNDNSGLLDGKYKYFFHGVGCTVHISKKEVVDFDYGETGRIDGFDSWRLQRFIATRSKKYPNVKESDIEKWLYESIEAKEVVMKESKEYGSLYYFSENT